MTVQYRQPLLVLFAVCAAFTCVASAVILALAIAGHADGEAGFVIKLVVRVVAFGGSAAALMIVLWRSRGNEIPDGPPDSPSPHWRLAIIPCALAAAIALPRLGATPHVEPDEWHHLDVARNLALHGLYASGNEDDGFILFDDYDSVGPPVIVTVAAAMRLAGPSIESARVVMALYFIALAGVVFAFCAPVFGGWAAVCSSALVVGTWGSAYLGRTLYGEAPALMFLLLALIAGRAALARRHAWAWGLAAGALFGLAVLSKYIILMAVWPILGALILDRFTAQRIGVRHLVSSAIGSLGIIGAWSIVQTFADRNVSGAAGGQLSMYQHNLLFGVEGLGNTAGYLAAQPASAIALMGALVFGIWLVNRRSADPTIAAIWLFAGFQWYWWLFFNTGNLPRYSWYGWAASAILLGPLLKMLIDALRGYVQIERLSRPLAAACFAAIIVPTAVRTAQEIRRAWVDDEMRYTRDLAAYVAERPDGDRIATAFWPLERSVQFLSGRTIARLGDTGNADEYDVVLVDSDTGARWIHNGSTRRFGPYAAVTVRE